ncbi:hypothetical protein KQI30_12945 [Clostridium bornimense]|uniref:hypothetical protein n=1 Tax=Clostridium bornimense TaxID=1216932 RepID=UPI001C10CB89|nr:hypothetical protein [Clostridium bornimense]MBU5317159.1 hypothetical protein [Clostridium bornimense]
MKSLKRALSAVLVYLTVFNLTPITAVASEELPKYLNVKNDILNEVIPYKDKAFVTYSKEVKNPNYNGTYNNEIVVKDNIAVLSNGSLENIDGIDNDKIGLFSVTDINENKINFMHQVYNDDSKNGIVTEYYKYNIETNKLKKLKSESDNKNLGKELLSKVNKSFNTNYGSDYTTKEYETKVYKDGNCVGKKFMLEITNVKNNSTAIFQGIYNDDFQYISQTSSFNVEFDKNGNMIIKELSDDNTLKILKYKNNKLINKATLSADENSMLWDSIVDGDDVYLWTYDVDTSMELVRYTLKDGKYKYSTSYGNNIIDITKDNAGNLWALRKENAKVFVSEIKNGTCTYRYQVSPIMTSLSIYDKDNFVVSGLGGYTQVNVQRDSNNNVIPDDTTSDNTHFTVNNTSSNNKVDNINSIKGKTTNSKKIDETKSIPKTGSPINSNTMVVLSLITILSGTILLRKH